jgi:hypothetical protein
MTKFDKNFAIMNNIVFKKPAGFRVSAIKIKDGKCPKCGEGVPVVR